MKVHIHFVHMLPRAAKRPKARQARLGIQNASMFMIQNSRTTPRLGMQARQLQITGPSMNAEQCNGPI